MTIGNIIYTGTLQGLAPHFKPEHTYTVEVVAGDMVVKFWGLSGDAILRGFDWEARRLQGNDPVLQTFADRRATHRVEEALGGFEEAEPDFDFSGANPEAVQRLTQGQSMYRVLRDMYSYSVLRAALGHLMDIPVRWRVARSNKRAMRSVL